MSQVEVVHFLLDTNESNSYLVVDLHSSSCLLVDAGTSDQRILRTVRDRNLAFIGVFLTHDHYDHSGGIDEVLSTLGGELFAGGGKTGCRLVADGETIEIGSSRGKVLSTPGHTADSVSLLVKSNVFTGDCLFAGSVGGTSGKEQHLQEIESIRSKILTLPDETRIYPGHGPPSTVGIERNWNPFLIHVGQG